ncbi:MAG: hypothetical protein M3Q51_06960, partial [Pseudomonadota bacterium]|nr:hypothetical protein [Pseudomonadota bacterium]
AAAAQRNHAPLVSLAQRLPSVFLFRELDDAVDRSDPAAWIASDAGGYYVRPMGDRIKGDAELHAPGMSRQLRAGHTQSWDRARPISEFRALGL